MSAVAQGKQKSRLAEIVQNWAVFGIMVVGIILAVNSYAWSLHVIGVGVVMGLFFVIRRTFPRRPSALVIIAAVSSAYVPLSYWLLSTFPGIYGNGFAAIVPWSFSVFTAIIAAVILTSVELFRTSKN